MAAGTSKGSRVVGKVAYIAVVGATEVVQVRNANIAALMLHLHVYPHFRAQPFIYYTKVLGFRNLV